MIEKKPKGNHPELYVKKGSRYVPLRSPMQQREKTKLAQATIRAYIKKNNAYDDYVFIERGYYEIIK